MKLTKFLFLSLDEEKQDSDLDLDEFLCGDEESDEYDDVDDVDSNFSIGGRSEGKYQRIRKLESIPYNKPFSSL